MKSMHALMESRGVDEREGVEVNESGVAYLQRYQHRCRTCGMPKRRSSSAVTATTITSMAELAIHGDPDIARCPSNLVELLPSHYLLKICCNTGTRDNQPMLVQLPSFAPVRGRVRTFRLRCPLFRFSFDQCITASRRSSKC